MVSLLHLRRRRLVASTLAAGVSLTGLALTAPPAAADSGSLGDLTAFESDGDTYTFSAGTAKLRVAFHDDDLVRVHLAPDGTFTDPANDDPEDPEAPDADIVVKDDHPGATSTYEETANAYVVTTDQATLTVTKSPITLALADEDGRPLWSEAAPLSWTDEGTVQTLEQRPQEQFYGGGMQNGRFSHRGEIIDITRDYDWNDGGNPNAAPFYLSSRGYGVLRNTFAPGRYDFGAPVRTEHEEQRFDAYYFVGDAREAIDGYTELTGRPAMMPMYALEVGDADCYLHNANRGERETLADSRAVAEGYTDHAMPLGWMLVNDGYGCGYEDLPETDAMLADHGSELGLWTEADLTEQEYEVSNGVRVRKTDVAWVGPGYRHALSACEKSQAGIEQHSPDRATVLTIEGWAGTQRCGAMWSGDQSGSWDYIRWQIPTYAGSTMSGQHMTTGDIDGIFGGSAKTYVRDLQWKMFLPMTYAMSGWAASDKQPWRYGSPYTEINRTYLQLHERLLPYFYTHSANAHRDGVGPTRPLVLNYPEDPNTWGEKVKYEFLAGDDFLVAPVYEDTTVRDDIYLPAGRWVDYWTGRVFQGQQTVDGYQAPLDTLPLFVRAGAIVPMFPEGTQDWKEGKESGRLDLDIYPQGDSSFTNYEDDGRTRAHADGEFANQTFEVTAPERGRGPVEVEIGALDGEYDGKPSARRYGLTVHTDADPGSVLLDRRSLAETDSPTELKARDSGWYFDDTRGVVHVKTPTISTADPAAVRLNGAAAVGGAHPDERHARVDLEVPAIAAGGVQSTVTAEFTNETGKPVDVTGTAVEAPQGWSVAPDGPTTTTALADGATFSARYTVTPTADAEPGSHEIAASASYVVRSRERAVTDQADTTVAYADLASAFNNVGVTTAEDPTPGDLDGGGSSFIADRLAQEGLTPGATVDANGFTFTWPESPPGTPDNVAGEGQTIATPGVGQGNALAFLGTGTSGAAEGSATVHYADGSTTEAALGFPNWCCLPTDRYGARIAVTTHGKNTPDGPAYPNVAYHLFTNTVRVDTDKQVVAVTLPANSAVHVFAVAVGDEEVVPPPVEDGQYTLSNRASDRLLAAPGDTNGAQLTTAAPSSSAAQRWTVSRHADGSYQVRNAGSGLCVDVAGSAQDSGAQVVQYTCTGTSNQRWVISNDDGRLTLAAQHSGLSLTARSDTLVVQEEDTAADTQRWRATPS